jgi:hypothetical protein
MNIPLLLNPLQEMAYPVEFNMETLLSLTAHAKRIAYVQSLLPRISSGSARVVFKIDDEKVLKVAKNKKGLAQNEAESDWGAQHYDIVAKTFDRDENYIFLEMELAKPVRPRVFEQLTGVSIDVLDQYLLYMHGHNTRNTKLPPTVDNIPIQELHDNPWIDELMHFIYDFDYPYPGDFSRTSSYGIVLRDNQPTVVLIDFGFTKNVMNSHYI